MSQYKVKGTFFRNFLTGKGFYVVLGLCMVAVGVAGWGAMRSVRPPTENTSSSVSSKASSGTAQAGVTVSGIPDDGWDPTYAVSSEGIASSAEASSEAASSAAAPSQRSSSATGEMQTPYQSYYMMPLSNGVMKAYSSELVYSETMKDWRVHEGVDFIGQKGEKVKAINDGTVTKIESDPLWGTIIVIDHGGGLVARYCGVAANTLVKEGDKVKMGNDIGIIGEVPLEAVEQYHLHLQIFVNEKSVDPLKIFEQAEAGSSSQPE